MRFPLPSWSSAGRFRRGFACLLAGVAMIVAALPGQAAESFRAALDGFTGEWQGEIQVFALDGFPLKNFAARRYYSWDGGEQVVVTRFFDGASDYEIRARQLVDLGRLQATVARPGQPAEEYAGGLEAGAVVWTNAAQNRRDYSERLVTTDGITQLETTSSEIMRVKGVSGVVRVTGTFARAAPPVIAAVPPPSANLPAQNPEAPPRERREQLEEQRVALESRLDAADARAARVPELERAVDELTRALAVARAAEASQSEAKLELEVTLAERATELAVVKAELNAARAAVDTAVEARERAAALEAKLADATALQRQLEQAKADQMAAVQRATGTDARLAEVQVQLQSAQTGREQAAAEATKLSDELAALRTDVEKMRSGSSAESVRIQELERHVAAADESRRQHDDIARNLQQELARAVAASAAANAERDRAQAAARGTTEELTLAKAQIEVLDRRVADATAEASRLGARVQELEIAAAATDESRRTATASSATVAREQATMRDQLAKLQRDVVVADEARQHAESETARLRTAGAALEQVRAGASEATARVAQLEQQVAAADRRMGELLADQARRDEQVRAQRDSDQAAAATTVIALAAERRTAQERLEQAEATGRAAAARVSELETQLATVRTRAPDTDAAGLAELRRTLAAAQAEGAASREQLEQVRADHDILASRLTGANEAMTATRAALHTAETAASAATALRAELDVQRALVTRREQELTVHQERSAVLAGERDAHATRIAELEQNLRTTPPPATGGGARDEMQAELTRLVRRVTELESERNTMRDTHAFGQNQLEQAQKLRDDTLARFRDVIAQLNTMREDRDRLARANVSLRSELRAALGSEEAPPSTAPAVSSAGGPSYLDRLLGNTEQPPTPVVPGGADRAIEEKIASLKVIGITRTPEEDKVILDGRLYRSGDIIDTALGLVFERIDGDELVFSDRARREFRRPF